jgi:hypothetical protein
MNVLVIAKDVKQEVVLIALAKIVLVIIVIVNILSVRVKLLATERSRSENNFVSRTLY